VKRPTDFLGQLQPDAHEALLARARRRTLDKGEYVYRVGDESDSVFLLLQGRAKTYKVSPEGHEVILWFCYPGELFGLAVHPHQRGRMVSVQACEHSEVAELSHASFERFLQTRPTESQLCLQAVMFRLGMLANRLVRQTADDAAARVAKLLLDLGSRQGGNMRAGRVALGITHQEIADMTGVQRQTVTRILGELSACGAVAGGYRKITIADRATLAEYAHHAAG
jgi:CRP/FNR family transcriptional regulator